MCVTYVMDSGSELEIGESHLNSSQVRYTHLRANTIEKDINPYLLPSSGLNN